MMVVRLCLIGLGLLLAGCAGESLSEPKQEARQRVLTIRDLVEPGASADVFEGYDRRFDAELKDSWTRKVDMSGVAFDRRRTCTLVTRSHVVMANHFRRAKGQQVVFHDREGKRVERTLVDVRSVVGDVAVGRLDEPLPRGFRAYPLLRASEGLGAELVGELVLVTDQKRRLYVHEVRGVHETRISFGPVAVNAVGFEKNLIVGDSGNPSFVLVNNEPVLVETHTTGGYGAGPFYGSEQVQTELARVIAEMGGEGQLRLVNF